MLVERERILRAALVALGRENYAAVPRPVLYPGLAPAPAWEAGPHPFSHHQSLLVPSVFSWEV